MINGVKNITVVSYLNKKYRMMQMGKYNLILVVLWMLAISCSGTKTYLKNNRHNPAAKELSENNLRRAIEIVDSAFVNYFDLNEMAMSRFYNAFTGNKSEETGSVWMYTAAIESVNNILKALQWQKENGIVHLYKNHHHRYLDMLHKLYEGLDYYKGTFVLTSYTQTKEWSIYGVHRSRIKNEAKVEGIENVYDDQMWLVRELLQSFKITQDKRFLEHAEYLTSYVLDGWDCTIDENGEERGGIPWGPGYVSKHSCSNGPMVSPLVWLHEYYENKNEPIEHRFIDVADGVSRKEEQQKKSDYYLLFAKKIYDWQKRHLLREDGVYDDMMGGCNPKNPEIKNINGTDYRVGILCKDRIGPAISYNSGTMISGASDLFRATADDRYHKEGKELAGSSFGYFAKLDKDIVGCYSYASDGFNNWFNGVLLRSYVDFRTYDPEIADFIRTFQKNLDYGYEHFLTRGTLPHDLLKGWEGNPDERNVEGMFMFAFGAEYAELAGMGE